MKQVYAAALLLWIILSTGACGESVGLRFCDPGETKACTCDSGEAGQMTCLPNGVAWSLCDCGVEGDISDGDSAENDDADMDADSGDGEEASEDPPEIMYCDENDRCPMPFRCDWSSGICELREELCRNDHDCTADQQYCGSYPGVDYGRCKDLCYLPEVQCMTGEICCEQDDLRRLCQGYEGRCINPDYPPVCLRDGDCPVAFYCDWPGGDIVRGHCLPRCYRHTDCPQELVCRDDRHCGAGMQNGDCGGDCPDGHICHPLYNTCVVNCPPCGPDQYCDAETAPECVQCINPRQCGAMMAPCCPGYTCSTAVYGVLGYCI